MWKRSYTGTLALCFLLLALSVGVARVFGLRFSSGGIFPAWSSFRAEPDGTRLLFDSLAATGTYRTVRSYKDLNQLHESNATILVLGLTPAALINASKTDLDELETLANAGNRVVVAIDSADRYFPKVEPTSALTKRWAIRLDHGFFSKSDGWAIDDSTKAGPTAIERAWGPGSIVLAADASEFSNKTLVDDAHTELLLRMLGPNTRVVFDESHLGIQDSGSVMGLAHKYRLDGALWGFLILALVFVWNRAAGFPPPKTETTQSTLGHDARTGLAQLLRRQIPVGGIIDVCLVEWKHFNARTRLPAIEQAPDPVATYRNIQERLTRQ